MIMMLRPLEMKDAEPMLEWMHDPEIVEFLQADFASKSIEDCRHFIEAARSSAEEPGGDIHLAAAGDEGMYLGTVSLRDIEDGAAEFAITMGRPAMGTGAAQLAMRGIIKRGFEDMGLSLIYWCVSPANHRAVRFYDKNGYGRTDVSLLPVKDRYTEDQKAGYIWYCVRS